MYVCTLGLRGLLAVSVHLHVVAVGLGCPEDVSVDKRRRYASQDGARPVHLQQASSHASSCTLHHPSWHIFQFLVRSFTHSLIHSLIFSFINLFIHSLIPFFVFPSTLFFFPFLLPFLPNICLPAIYLHTRLACQHLISLRMHIQISLFCYVHLYSSLCLTQQHPLPFIHSYTLLHQDCTQHTQN